MHDYINLIGVLQETQEECGYLRKDRLEELSAKLEIPLSRIYSVATYYKSFSLIPPAKHTVTVCMGTACYVRGAPRIVERISQILNIRPGETTPDSMFKLETVNCLGACALGPLVVIDGEYYGEMSPQKIGGIINNYR